MVQWGTYHREHRVHSVITRFSYGVGVFRLQQLKWFSPYDRLPSLRHFLSPALAEIEIIATPPDGPIQIPPSTTPVLPGAYLRLFQPTFRPGDGEPFGNSTSFLRAFAMWPIPPETRNVSTAIRSCRLSPPQTASSPYLADPIIHQA